MSEILQEAQRMLQKHPLCNHCLGRQFALLGHGVYNEKRGEALKLLLTMSAHQQAVRRDKKALRTLQILASNGNFPIATEILKKLGKKAVEGKRCFLCLERFDSLEALVKLASKKLKDYEYDTFLVGIELPTDVEEREDEFKGEFTVEHGESLRNEFSRNLGKRLADVTGKATDYGRPDIVVLVNPFTDHISLQVNPIHISGRYRKVVRDIPQSRWLCSHCRGKGCRQCNWTGKMYPESVEEIIGTPTLEITAGNGIAFHGAGREDIDARMLGRGRPFVVEVKKPRRRFIDLQRLQKTINEKALGKVEVTSLCFSDKDFVRKLKRGEEAQKLYRAIVEVDKPVSKRQTDLLKKSLSGAVIRQQTPRRVAHRRADLVREKYIYKTDVKRLTPNRFEIKIRCQGGLYIKELVTGDEGRTIPNVAQILNVRAVPSELDVLGVYLEEEK